MRRTRALCGSISTAACCCNFAGPRSPSNAGLLAYRELDDTLGLTDTGAARLADVRTGKNGRHRLAGLLRQSVFGRLAGYEDVNDADRLCRDPAMCWAVADLPGQWILRVSQPYMPRLLASFAHTRQMPLNVARSRLRRSAPAERQRSERDVYNRSCRLPVHPQVTRNLANVGFERSPAA